ncbi:hypothetical protein [Amycolatopsis methanolica]|uniref:DNA-damage-inducible protein D n=1 Tax=Amycolatopsis methanolica 239 TaxID=1068978 RepID=A0A076MYY8_AMYME|nr:hypothetical protein [Amycolatopsis methanolica]AIJ26350.1 hypothetical protein AMETH_6258 [Amycolatopsis methanolica 239]AIJ26409.1 hypothetical protein AMETH_6317 [Amycolatopsis methanolica 239]
MDPINAENSLEAASRDRDPGHDSTSPFDRIKQTRADGTEYWSARHLQGLMGYARWQNLQPAIARAMQTASNTGMDVSREFAQVTPIMASQHRAAGGRFAPNGGEDYELSRQAAYLVAMNGDPNKPEVADAQAYFAARTEQAEAIESDLAELPEWARQQIDTIRRVGKIEVEQVRQRERLTAVESRLDGIEGKHNWYSALGYSRKMGLPTSTGATRALGKRASQICRSRGIRPQKTQHQLYGEVNLYPEEVLTEASRPVPAP